MYKRTTFTTLFVVVALLLLAACAPTAPVTDAGDSATGDTPAGSATLRYNLFSEPPTLDPALSTDTTSSNVIKSTMIGLTRLNPVDNAAEPALATEWSVSEDGLTWTFRLRDDVPWVDYNADTGAVEEITDESGAVRYVTAQDVVYGITRACDAATASDYAYILYVIEGCQAANSGEGSLDDIAVTAVDDTTLEIVTTYSASFFPQIVSMPTAFPAPQWVIEEFAETWTEPENIVGNGPYALAEWIHSDSMQLVRNPFWPGWEEDDRVGNIEVIDFVMVDEDSTEFAMYENNELDDTRVPLDQIDTVFGADSAFGDQGNTAPVNCTYYYGFVTQKEGVDDVNVRRALSMAVDRKTLVEQVTKGGQIPANTFTNPANFGSAAEDPDIAPWALTEDQGGIGYEAAVEMANELMAEAGYPGGEGLNLTIGHNVSEAHARIAQAVQAMWTAAFPGIQVNIESQEWGVYLGALENDAPMETKPHVYRLGWCKDYPHANNWMHEVFNPDAGSNSVMITPDDPQVGSAVAEYSETTYAAQVAEPEESVALYKRAEELLIDEIAAIIPIYYYTTVRATKPWLERVYTEDGDLKFEYWSIDTASQEGL